MSVPLAFHVGKDMKFTDVMFDDLTEDQLRSLPREWIAHYLGRPTRDKIDRAKHAMWFRSTLIAALFVYRLCRDSCGTDLIMPPPAPTMDCAASA